MSEDGRDNLVARKRIWACAILFVLIVLSFCCFRTWNCHQILIQPTPWHGELRLVSVNDLSFYNFQSQKLFLLYHTKTSTIRLHLLGAKPDLCLPSLTSCSSSTPVPPPILPHPLNCCFQLPVDDNNVSPEATKPIDSHPPHLPSVRNQITALWQAADGIRRVSHKA